MPESFRPSTNLQQIKRIKRTLLRLLPLHHKFDFRLREAWISHTFGSKYYNKMGDTFSSLVAAITCVINLLFVGGSPETLPDCISALGDLMGGGTTETATRRGLIRRSLLEPPILPDENESLRGAVHKVQLE